MLIISNFPNIYFPPAKNYNISKSNFEQACGACLPLPKLDLTNMLWFLQRVKISLEKLLMISEATHP
jgi:hypothetical protein